MPDSEEKVRGKRFLFHVIAFLAVFVGAAVSHIVLRGLLGLELPDAAICILGIGFGALVNALLFSRV
jgi:hypothetical protein